MPKTSNYDVYVRILEIQANIIKNMQESKTNSDEEDIDVSKKFNAKVVAIIENFQGDFVQTKTSGDSFENITNSVIANKGSTAVGIFEKVAESFKKARSLVESNEDIVDKEKAEINKKLHSLETELKKKEPDLKKTQRLFNWIKKNANWVVPEITKITCEIIKGIFAG